MRNCIVNIELSICTESCNKSTFLLREPCTCDLMDINFTARISEESMEEFDHLPDPMILGDLFIRRQKRSLFSQHRRVKYVAALQDFIVRYLHQKFFMFYNSSNVNPLVCNNLTNIYVIYYFVINRNASEQIQA